MTDFVTQAGIIDTLNEVSGLLYLLSTVGTPRGLLRVNYTGGYWVDISDNESGSLPSGATALPKDLQMAWLLQCQHIWSKRDNLGIDHAVEQDRRQTFTNLELVPEVKDILNDYRRIGLTI